MVIGLAIATVELVRVDSSTAVLASRPCNAKFSFLFKTNKFNTEFNLHRHGRCMVHGAYSVHGPGRGCHDVEAERESFFLGDPWSMMHPWCMVDVWSTVHILSMVQDEDATMCRLNGNLFL